MGKSTRRPATYVRPRNRPQPTSTTPHSSLFSSTRCSLIQYTSTSHPAASCRNLSHMASLPTTSFTPTSPLSPLASIELRLRHLEYLLSGQIASLPARKSSESKHGGPTNDTEGSDYSVRGVLSHILALQQGLEKAVEGKLSLERFVDDCTC